MKTTTNTWTKKTFTAISDDGRRARWNGESFAATVAMGPTQLVGREEYAAIYDVPGFATLDAAIEAADAMC
jgi:hypothetical protein